MSKRVSCPVLCPCMCHDTGGAHYGMHGENGRCPTKDGLAPLTDEDMDWYIKGTDNRKD